MVEKTVLADEAVGGEVYDYVCCGKVEVLVVGGDVYDTAVTAYLNILNFKLSVHR